MDGENTRTKKALPRVTPRGVAVCALALITLALLMSLALPPLLQPPPSPTPVTPRYVGQPILSRAAPPPEGLMDMNAADLAALKTLPGIGDTLARRILEARPLYYIEDLLTVPGIGEKKFADLAALTAVYGE